MRRRHNLDTSPPCEPLGRQIARALIKIGLERMDHDDLEQVLGAVVGERNHRQALEAERMAAPWRQRRRAKEARKAALKPHRATLRALADLALQSPETFRKHAAELLAHLEIPGQAGAGLRPPAPPPPPPAPPADVPAACSSPYPAQVCRCAKCRERLGWA